MKWRADCRVNLSKRIVDEFQDATCENEETWNHWLKSMDLEKEGTEHIWVFVEYDDGECE